MLTSQNPTLVGLWKAFLEKARNFDTTTSGQNQSEEEKAFESQKSSWGKTSIACCRGNPAQAKAASPRLRMGQARQPQTRTFLVLLGRWFPNPRDLTNRYEHWNYKHSSGSRSWTSALIKPLLFTGQPLMSNRQSYLKADPVISKQNT